LNVDPDVFARHAGLIEQIRYELAHARPAGEKPRPACSLEDEEEEDDE